MSPAPILSAEQAAHLAQLTVDDVSLVIKLASLGLKAKEIQQYAAEIAEGGDPEIDLAPGAPRPVVIHAWSFVKDRGQYHSTYGLSSAQAGELLDLLHTDPKDAVKRIQAIVSERLRLRGSSRPVVVDLEGAPSSTSAKGGAPPSGDGGLSLLRQEIKRNSGVYGSYRFTAYPTSRPGGQAFAVGLGGGLYAFGQSKAVAVAAARIARVKGRSDDLVRPYIHFWMEGSSPRAASDIPAKVWDGRLGPHTEPPAEPATKAKTEAPTTSGGRASTPKGADAA